MLGGLFRFAAGFIYRAFSRRRAECSATAEVVCGCGCNPACAYLVRVHQGPNAKLGDPFTFAAVVRRDGDHAVIVGGAGVMNPVVHRAFLDGVRKLGFVRRRWCRVKDGVAIWHERRL